MANAGEDYQGWDRVFSDLNTRIKDLEERNMLLKDKMQLISNNYVKERDKNFKDIQELKKNVELLKMEGSRMKEMLARVGEIVDKSARKEDLAILQRQFDLFRE
jgi:hypothetical protein